MLAREHIPFFCVISRIYADKVRLKTSLWVSTRPISSRECLRVLSQNPFVKREFATHKERKCREKTHRQWAYLLGRKLLRRRRSTSLQWRWFHTVIVIILLLDDSRTLAFSLLLRSNGYRQTSSFGNKGFLLLCLQLSTLETQQPSPCFLWVNYPATCLQQCALHYSLVNVRHCFCKPASLSFPPNDVALMKIHVVGIEAWP